MKGSRYKLSAPSFNDSYFESLLLLGFSLFVSFSFLCTCHRCRVVVVVFLLPFVLYRILNPPVQASRPKSSMGGFKS